MSKQFEQAIEKIEKVLLTTFFYNEKVEKKQKKWNFWGILTHNY